VCPWYNTEEYSFMEDFRTKKKIRKRLYSRGVFILLIVVTVLLLKGTWGAWDKQAESKENLKKVEGSLLEARAREEKLGTSIEGLQTPQGLEKEIRGRFSVAKPGEEVILIVEENASEDEGTLANRPWWKKVKDWFSTIFRLRIQK